MADQPDTRTIHGHQIELSEGRKVWAGDNDDSWYIRFDDGNGGERRLRISYEAADALVKLISKPETILRYVLTVDGEETKWEKFEPELVGASSPQETGQ